MDGAAALVQAAWAAIGGDGLPACHAWAWIFPEIAAMKAGRPTVRKMRAMAAWIRSAVRILRQHLLGFGLAKAGNVREAKNKAQHNHG